MDSLWMDIRHDKEVAFEELFLHSNGFLFNYGMHFTRNKEQVLYAIQSLFVYIWEHRSSLSQPADVKNYLLKAFRNTLLRKNKPAIIDFTTPYFETSIEDKIIAKEDASTVQKLLTRALTQLSDRQKEIIFLRFYDKKTTDDIAEIMGITPKATYKLMARALQMMRKEMGVLHFLFWLTNIFLKK